MTPPAVTLRSLTGRAVDVLVAIATLHMNAEKEDVAMTTPFREQNGASFLVRTFICISKLEVFYNLNE